MKTADIKPSQDVFFTSNAGDGSAIRAKVGKVKRGGWVDVVAYFFTDQSGEDMGGFLGYTFTMRPRELRMVA